MTVAPATCLSIQVDPARCRAAGECVLRAPGSFAMTQGGKAHFIAEKREPEDVIISAARSCPNFAISVTRDGNELA